MTMDDAAYPKGFKYTPEVYKKLAEYAKSNPYLDRVVTNTVCRRAIDRRNLFLK